MEKDFGMFSNSHPARHLAQTLSSQYIPSPYGDFGDYHPQAPGFGDPLCTPLTAPWSSVYAAPREEWAAFGQGFPGSSHIDGQASYDTPELTDLHPAFAEGSCASLTRATGRPPPNAVRGKSYEWTRDWGPPVSASGAEHHSVPTAGDSRSSGGKTRTRDKYRVVYSDHQRLVLEEEFHCSHYITIQKKSQLSLDLHLSERQVKIWFQNRRAKERKLTRRKLQVSQQASATSPEEADADPRPRAPPAPRGQC